MRPLWLLPLALLSIPGVMAQDAGCTQNEPCPHFVDIGAEGLQGDDLNATVGDWYSLSIFNGDAMDHDLRLSGYGLQWSVPGEDVVETQPFQLDQTGDFVLSDLQTGDQIMVRVFANDVVDVETGNEDPAYQVPEGDNGSKGDERAPGLPILMLFGVLALASVRRR